MSYASINVRPIPMRIVVDAASLAVQAGENLLIWGDPGIGKSAAVAAVARSLGRECRVLSLAQCLPEDLGGLRFLDPVARRATICADSWAHEIAAAPGGGVLFLDEVNQASPPVQAAAMPVILDHVLQGLTLPASVAVIMAANPVEIATAGQELAPAVANRTCHVLADAADLSGYLAAKRTGEWYTSPVKLPADWRGRIGRWDALVGTYIGARPSALTGVPAEGEPARGCAWASRRSFDASARWLAACEAAGYGLTDDLTVAGVEGWIGPAAAGEFLSWIAAQDLLDPEAALADPAGCALPARGDRLAAVLDGVIRAAIADHPARPARWVAAWAVLARVAAAGTPDIAVPAAIGLANWGRTAGGRFPVPATASAFTAILDRIAGRA